MNLTTAQRIVASATDPHQRAVEFAVYKRDTKEGKVYFFEDGSTLTFELKYILKGGHTRADYGSLDPAQRLAVCRGGHST